MFCRKYLSPSFDFCMAWTSKSFRLQLDQCWWKRNHSSKKFKPHMTEGCRKQAMHPGHSIVGTRMCAGYKQLFFLKSNIGSPMCETSGQMQPISHINRVLYERSVQFRMTIMCRLMAMSESHIQCRLAIMYKPKEILKVHAQRMMTNVQDKGSRVRHHSTW